MEHRSHVSFTSESTRFSLVAGLVVALFIANTTLPAGAQTNTSLGSGALSSVTTGIDNTALGFAAMNSDTTGSHNTATGFDALLDNNADDNTATGYGALTFNTIGTENTATGLNALNANTSGADNTATGAGALQENTTGFSNNATGSNALKDNTTGVENAATGTSALVNNTTGGQNTAAGRSALAFNTTGSGNIAIGFEAGQNLTTGNNNIDIGNQGIAGESGIIRIGTQGVHIHTVIAGINNTHFFSGSPVLVNAYGRLGSEVSSARYKQNIRDMGAASDRLMKLRPVTFRYKEDPDGTLQYGLVAEEVAQVYPELVVYGNDGKPLSVAYLTLPAMLLNEVQKQARENRQKDAQLAALQKQVESLQKETAQIDGLTARLTALEHSRPKLQE
jgi:hypothetical protein